MNSLLLNALVWHILLGTTAIVAFTGVSLLLKGKDLNVKLVKIYSLLGFLGFLGSWIFGGYYYATYYASEVKPLILAGATPLIHQILMESKEHVFLFLPFLASTICLLLYSLSKEIGINEKLKKSLILLSLLIVTLGIIITLSGIAISGAVTKKSQSAKISMLNIAETAKYNHE